METVSATEPRAQGENTATVSSTTAQRSPTALTLAPAGPSPGRFPSAPESRGLPHCEVLSLLSIGKVASSYTVCGKEAYVTCYAKNHPQIILTQDSSSLRNPFPGPVLLEPG